MQHLTFTDGLCPQRRLGISIRLQRDGSLVAFHFWVASVVWPDCRCFSVHPLDDIWVLAVGDTAAVSLRAQVSVDVRLHLLG